jgi:hypothetical protein
MTIEVPTQTFNTPEKLLSPAERIANRFVLEGFTDFKHFVPNPTGKFVKETIPAVAQILLEQGNLVFTVNGLAITVTKNNFEQNRDLLQNSFLLGNNTNITFVKDLNINDNIPTISDQIQAKITQNLIIEMQIKFTNEDNFNLTKTFEEITGSQQMSYFEDSKSRSASKTEVSFSQRKEIFAESVDYVLNNPKLQITMIAPNGILDILSKDALEIVGFIQNNPNLVYLVTEKSVLPENPTQSSQNTSQNIPQNPTQTISSDLIEPKTPEPTQVDYFLEGKNELNRALNGLIVGKIEGSLNKDENNYLEILSKAQNQANSESSKAQEFIKLINGKGLDSLKLNVVDPNSARLALIMLLTYNPSETTLEKYLSKLKKDTVFIKNNEGLNKLNPFKYDKIDGNSKLAFVEFLETLKNYYQNSKVVDSDIVNRLSSIENLWASLEEN